METAEERLEIALDVALDRVDLVGSLVVAFAGMAFGVSVAEVGFNFIVLK